MNFANNFLFLFSIKKEKEYDEFEKSEGTLKSETLQFKNPVILWLCFSYTFCFL